MRFFNLKKKSDPSLTGSSFTNPSVLEVNLIKDEMEVDFELNKRLFSLFLALFVAALFVAEIYFGLDWWQTEEEKKAVALKNEYERVSLDVKNTRAQSDEMTTFKDKLTISQKIIDNHIYWTNFFSWIEKNTLNSVSYAGLSGDVTGKYSLGATTNNYRDISWQVRNFKNDKYVLSALVGSGASAGAGKEVEAVTTDPITGKTVANKDFSKPKVSFSLELEVKPEIFFR